MKKLVLSSVAVALLVFSGCSSTEPAVEDQTANAQEQTQTAQEVEAPQTETVAAEDSVVGSTAESLKHMSADEIEKLLPVVYFDFDQFEIRADMQERISKAVELGKTDAINYSVKLEGNCDEWGSDEYNFALGLKRAEAVKKAFVAEGIDPARISMVSYGESNPVCTEKTKECWAKNRRVDFKLLP